MEQKAETFYEIHALKEDSKIWRIDINILLVGLQ